MANFQLAENGSRPIYEYSSHIRMGALSVFVLVAIICLAVLAVLSYTTAHASLTMAQRQAEAMEQQYAAERAAQDFVAQVDGALAGGGAAELSSASLQAFSAHAAQEAGGEVDAQASMDGDRISASFTCKNGRTLTVAITVVSNASYRIDAWMMSTVENPEPVEGKLFIAG